MTILNSINIKSWYDSVICNTSSSENSLAPFQGFHSLPNRKVYFYCNQVDVTTYQLKYTSF